MSKFEYHTENVDPEILFQILNDRGLEGWELCFLLPAQKLIQSKILGQQPQVTTIFLLIFKRLLNG
jgi:hypothetical protein